MSNNPGLRLDSTLENMRVHLPASMSLSREGKLTFKQNFCVGNLILAEEGIPTTVQVEASKWAQIKEKIGDKTVRKTCPDETDCGIQDVLDCLYGNPHGLEDGVEVVATVPQSPSKRQRTLSCPGWSLSWSTW